MKIMKRRVGVFAALMVAMAMLLPGYVWGQINLGSIQGTVQDIHQAVVPGAQLTLTDEGTGVSHTAVSSGSGHYEFINLAPGTYDLTAGAKGFSTAVQKGILLVTGATVGITITLNPGQVNQTVTVSANAAQVETQTSEIDTTISPKEMESLPVSLSGDMRNPLNFVVLTPGVMGSTPGGTPDYRLHFSGSVSDSNEVYTDGIPYMQTDDQGQVGDSHLPLGAVGEFRVISSNQTAKYGFSSGIVSFAIKSGTNHFHGSLFDYLQNDALNANGFVTNALGLKKAPLKQNDFGGTFGGPVWIPKVYNGHDKTFFFTTWEGFAYRPSSNNATLTTFPSEFRQGNFQQILGPQLTGPNNAPMFDAEGRPIYSGEIYNPFTEHSVVGPDGKTYNVLDPFGSGSTLNEIPSGSPALSTVSQTVLKEFPTANSDALQNNFERLQSSKIDEHRFVLKVTHHFSPKQSLSGDLITGNYQNSNNGGLNLSNATTLTVTDLQGSLAYNWAYSSTLLNNLNIGYNRNTVVNGALQPGPDFSGLGIKGALPPLGPHASYPGIGIVNIDGIGGIGTSFNQTNRYIINDNLTMIRGNHTFTFGGEVRDLERNEGGSGSGAFNFATPESAMGGVGFVNGSQPVGIPNSTGNAAASFLFGNVDFVNFGFPIEQAYRWKQFGLFAQDDWRVTPKLTLNLGIRYDLQIPRSDAKGQVSTMNPTLPNPSAGGLPGAYEFFGKGPGRNGRYRLGNIDYKGFQPRIGFAYSPFSSGRTAIRGGFSVVRPIGNDNSEEDISGGQYSAGFSGLAQYSRGGDGVLTTGYLWDQPYPASNVTAPGSQLNPGQLVGNDNPAMIHPSAGEPPFQMYWSTQVQQQLTSSMIFSVGYVGMHTYHLGIWSKPNQINPVEAQKKYGNFIAANNLTMPQFLTLPINSPIAAAAGITPPWPGFQSIFGVGATVGQALRPWPQYGDVDNPLNPIGGVSYNAMQASLQKRFSHGLTFLVSYTFSKTMGNVDSNSGPTSGAENAIYAGSFYQNYYSNDGERSVTSSDIPNNVAISYTYQLPIGQGKQFLNRGGISNEVFGGWSVSGIQRYMSGRPIHIEYDATGASNPYFAAGDGYSFRPNIVPGQPFKNPKYSKSCSGPIITGAVCSFYINPGAFSSPAIGTFGDAPNLISSLRMPAYLNEDLSVSKSTKLAGSLNLQFQANFFNAFNRVVFSNGGNAVTFIQQFAPKSLSPADLAADPNTIFGMMTAQQNAPRLIQFGMKLEF